jgi:hypothetical protein
MPMTRKSTEVLVYMAVIIACLAALLLLGFVSPISLHPSAVYQQF